ncbi:hypothetical protein C8R31_105112 [Nitrosospira sp. Nsp2]|nr:hypothetical protein C8R31_105112 [Nitrosospira sp. Nsp2]
MSTCLLPEGSGCVHSVGDCGRVPAIFSRYLGPFVMAEDMGEYSSGASIFVLLQNPIGFCAVANLKRMVRSLHVEPVFPGKSPMKKELVGAPVKGGITGLRAL